jgi:hypothetical protein
MFSWPLCRSRPGTTQKPIHLNSWQRFGKFGTFVRGMLVGGGSYELAQAIMPAIDDYAEHETGNREYFWRRLHSIG